MFCILKIRNFYLKLVDKFNTVYYIIIVKQMKTMKKKYIKPAMEVLSYDAQAALLAGSGDSYWVPPDEPEEGCESAWHCGGW